MLCARKAGHNKRRLRIGEPTLEDVSLAKRSIGHAELGVKICLSLRCAEVRERGSCSWDAALYLQRAPCRPRPFLYLSGQHRSIECAAHPGQGIVRAPFDLSWCIPHSGESKRHTTFSRRRDGSSSVEGAETLIPVRKAQARSSTCRRGARACRGMRYQAGDDPRSSSGSQRKGETAGHQALAQHVILYATGKVRCAAYALRFCCLLP